MKRVCKILLVSVISAVIAIFMGCSSAVDYFGGNDNSSEISESTNSSEKSIYDGFENYPKGKESSKGLLTLTNDANTAVLVFTDSVQKSNYIGTIPALSSIKVELPTGKFYSIVSVSKEAYEKDSALAVQTSVLVYYSDIQAYSVSVSPENMTGTATWIFNNYTSYWASIEKVDGSGETFAVIAPYAKLVMVPVQTNKNYDYKIVYKKQLKYNGNIIAVSNKTSTVENDTASFMNLTSFTTDLYGDATKDNSDLAPTVKLVNQTGKTLRIYNGQVQLSDNGLQVDDYTLASGLSAFFTGFSEGEMLTNINIRNISWAEKFYCTDTTTVLKNGYVYTVIVSNANSYRNYGYNNKSNKEVVLKWTVSCETANNFYTEE